MPDGCENKETVGLFIHRDNIKSKNNENDITGRKAKTEEEIPASGTWFDHLPEGLFLMQTPAISSLETMKTKPDSEKSLKFIFIQYFSPVREWYRLLGTPALFPTAVAGLAGGNPQGLFYAQEPP